MFRYLLNAWYCQVLPKDELNRENTEDTIVPYDFVPVNEGSHQNPFDTTYSWNQFLNNT